MKLVGGRAVLAEDALDLELEPLARERPAVEDEQAVACLGAAEQLASRVERGLATLLRPPQTVELGRGLAASAILEALPVDDDLHAAAAQVVGELERERGRDRGGLDPELREGADDHLELGLRGGRSRRQQLVDPEPLRRQRLDPRVGGNETRHLERA